MTGNPSGGPYSLEDDLDELLDVSPSPWGKLADAEIFVTGATGLFGRWMLASLFRAADKLGLRTRVTALVRDPEGWRKSAPELAGSPFLTILEGDLFDFEFPKTKFTHVLHLAAPTNLVQRDNQFMSLDILVQGTRRVLDLAAASGAGGFLMASSAAVYGRHPKKVAKISESCLEAPDVFSPATGFYDEGKRVAELLCAHYWRTAGLRTVVARCFSFVGPFLSLDTHFAVGNIIRDALVGGPIVLTGDGTPLRSYLYLADLAWWLWVALVDGLPGRAYNVGGEEQVSIGALAEKVGGFFSPPLTVIVSKAPPPDGPPQSQVPCLKRAREELGLYQRISLDEALRRTINWARGLR
ncbi:MAG: NAD-dependent epimerase/dehydratase family protein [Deltaproteobacteria bacterium]|jgi:dTDP-glucose 4,6-dehydratase|nr:NAD-dependent epimerase/dehydratase family protein [Deltaproteobacteria bacterium]